MLYKFNRMDKQELPQTKAIKVEPINMEQQKIIEAPMKKEGSSPSTMRRMPLLYEAACKAYDDITSSLRYLDGVSEKDLVNIQRAVTFSRVIEQDTYKKKGFQALHDLIEFELNHRAEIRRRTNMKRKEEQNQRNIQEKTKTNINHQKITSLKENTHQNNQTPPLTKANKSGESQKKTIPNNQTPPLTKANKSGESQKKTHQKQEAHSISNVHHHSEAKKSAGAKGKETVFSRIGRLWSSLFRYQQPSQSYWNTNLKTGKRQQKQQQQQFLLSSQSSVAQAAQQFVTVNAAKNGKSACVAYGDGVKNCGHAVHAANAANVDKNGNVADVAKVTTNAQKQGIGIKFQAKRQKIQ